MKILSWEKQTSFVKSRPQNSSDSSINEKKIERCAIFTHDVIINEQDSKGVTEQHNYKPFFEERR